VGRESAEHDDHDVGHWYSHLANENDEPLKNNGNFGTPWVFGGNPSALAVGTLFRFDSDAHFVGQTNTQKSAMFLNVGWAIYEQIC
jgi:hypothetical protein